MKNKLAFLAALLAVLALRPAAQSQSNSGLTREDVIHTLNDLGITSGGKYTAPDLYHVLAAGNQATARDIDMGFNGIAFSGSAAVTQTITGVLEIDGVGANDVPSPLWLRSYVGNPIYLQADDLYGNSSFLSITPSTGLNAQALGLQSTAGNIFGIDGLGNASFSGTLNGTHVTSGFPIIETSGGTNQNTYSQGDMLYASAANTLSKVGLGGTGTVFHSNGSAPSWQSLVAADLPTALTANTVTSAAGQVATLAGAAGTGTNGAAGGATLDAGASTGTGVADALVTTGFKLGSGSSAQTKYDRYRATNNTKTLSNTTATPTIFCLLTNAVTDSGGGCQVVGTIELIDGTHHVGSITFSMWITSVNQNGTVTAACSTFTAGSNGQILTGGTYTGLTTTTTVTISGTNVQLKVTPSWSGGTPTTTRLTYQVQVNGQANATPQ